jgi:hypothetical protein
MIPQDSSRGIFLQSPGSLKCICCSQKIYVIHFNTNWIRGILIPFYPLVLQKESVMREQTISTAKKDPALTILAEIREDIMVVESQIETSNYDEAASYLENLQSKLISARVAIIAMAQPYSSRPAMVHSSKKTQALLNALSISETRINELTQSNTSLKKLAKTQNEIGEQNASLDKLDEQLNAKILEEQQLNLALQSLKLYKANVEKLSELQASIDKLTTANQQATSDLTGSQPSITTTIEAVQQKLATLKAMQADLVPLSPPIEEQIRQKETSIAAVSAEKSQISAAIERTERNLTDLTLEFNAMNIGETAYMWALGKLNTYYQKNFTKSDQKSKLLGPHVHHIIQQVKLLKKEGKEPISDLTDALVLTYHRLTDPKLNPVGYERRAMQMAGHPSVGLQRLGKALLTIGCIALILGLIIVMPPAGVTAAMVVITAALASTGLVSAIAGGITLFKGSTPNRLAGAMQKVHQLQYENGEPIASELPQPSS